MTVKFLDNLTKTESNEADPYTIKIITNDAENPIITGWIADESLEIGTENNWTELYSIVGGGSIETLNNILVGVAGFSLRTQQMYKKIWTGSNTIEIKLGIIFQSETDPKTEVWDKIWRLYRIAVPEEGGNFQNFLANASFGFGKKEIKLLGDNSKEMSTKITSSIKGFFTGAADSPFKIPVISEMATFTSKIVEQLLDTGLLSPPGSTYKIKNIIIGKMLNLNNVKIKNISISPSLNNIGVQNSGSRQIVPQQYSPKVYPNYAKVELTLMTDTIWTTDNITKIMDDSESLFPDK